ncbi:hypothetical protein IFM89_024586 [Coptis chinensis]|uniref:Cytochrome P450 n=1 Tax=Coptis chinensis TaxID=261450 RepID=A0A835M4S8_9MAGN|nr:hypothetical protein IFM89_024586 [Coptis chinensis]
MRIHEKIDRLAYLVLEAWARVRFGRPEFEGFWVCSRIGNGEETNVPSGPVGKGMWLELIGSDGNIAKATIERQNPLVIAIVLLEGTPVSRDFRPTRGCKILSQCPTRTFVLHRALGSRQIFTANPSNVQHILKTKFSLYPKGDFFSTTLVDFLGHGIFNADGDNWKFERQISSHEFNTKSLRKFVETVVDSELSNRLIPILSDAAANNSVLDLQDILQRFAFDNICKIAFGFDHLSPSLPQAAFAVAFEDALRISCERFSYIVPAIWKLKRVLNIGSEKQLKEAVLQVREFAEHIVKEKKQELKEKSSLETVDLLSRIMDSGHLDDGLVIDMVISFIVAGRDTTSAALTWFSGYYLAIFMWKRRYLAKL